ncbi:RWP-RK domain-containing protein [Tribonema minus]|uniref:RWP-RK domain-containing protein n=1 Tax=Tribonema minus TaxID=303371 RepID=A0A835YUX8_9STRA|nr:RWP-RK domain-containing protein [Tribonema minus]
MPPVQHYMPMPMAYTHDGSTLTHSPSSPWWEGRYETCSNDYNSVRRSNYAAGPLPHRRSSESDDWWQRPSFSDKGVVALETLQASFHLPINLAADRPGICMTALKKICRRRGIQRWPFRTSEALEKTIESVHTAMSRPHLHSEDRTHYQQQLQAAHARLQEIRHLSSPNAQTSDNDSEVRNTMAEGHIYVNTRQGSNMRRI